MMPTLRHDLLWHNSCSPLAMLIAPLPYFQTLINKRLKIFVALRQEWTTLLRNRYQVIAEQLNQLGITISSSEVPPIRTGYLLTGLPWRMKKPMRLRWGSRSFSACGSTEWDQLRFWSA